MSLGIFTVPIDHLLLPIWYADRPVCTVMQVSIAKLAFFLVLKWIFAAFQTDKVELVIGIGLVLVKRIGFSHTTKIVSHLYWDEAPHTEIRFYLSCYIYRYALSMELVDWWRTHIGNFICFSTRYQEPPAAQTCTGDWHCVRILDTHQLGVSTKGVNKWNRHHRECYASAIWRTN